MQSGPDPLTRPALRWHLHGMSARLLRRFRRLPVAVKATLAALVLLAAYLPVVAVMEAREEARIEALRNTDPAAYLEAVRAHGGMASYLEALANVRHFDDWREAAPTFLIGAWGWATRPRRPPRTTCPRTIQSPIRPTDAAPA